MPAPSSETPPDGSSRRSGPRRPPGRDRRTAPEPAEGDGLWLDGGAEGSDPEVEDQGADGPPRATRRLTRKQRNDLTLAITALAALAAAFGPATFTGNATVDVVERVLVVGLVTFVGAHAHRWTWFVAGALAAVPARGVSLGLVLLGLLAAIVFSRARRRSRPAGALAVGLIANGTLWYPADVLPTGLSHAAAVAALVLVVGSGFGEVGRRHKRTVSLAFAALGLLLVVGVGAAAYVGITARNELQQGTSSARRALQSVRAGESDEAQTSLAEAEAQLAGASRRFDGPLASAVGVVPGLAQQVDAVETSVDQALEVTRAADELLATDYDQLRYDGRIDLAQVTELVPQSQRVRDALASADRELAELRTRSLLPPLRDRVEEFSAQVTEAHDDAVLAADLLEVAPGLLGADGDRHYLVVFLAPAELRGSGGFVGNFVELSARSGDVDLDRSGRIGELIGAAPPGQRTLVEPPDYVARYGDLRPQDNLQDVTLSPNWPSVGSVYAQLYPQSGGRAVDGVIGVDPTGLAGLLELTGPVPVPGFPGFQLTSENVVAALTTEQYLIFGDDSERREDFLEASIRATFDRLTTAALPAPRAIGDALGDPVRGRHIQLWSPVTVERQLFEQLDADGEIAVPAGQDGFSVVQQNAGNNKIDAYLRRKVSYRATLDADDGSVEGEISVQLTNEVPSTDLPRIVVGNNRGVPVGTNLSSLSLFTPLTVTGATIDDRNVVLSPDTEVGLKVWDTPLLSIPPGRTVTVVFQVEGPLDLTSDYRFRYLPQPQAIPEEFSADIRVRGARFTEANGTNGLEASGPTEVTIQLGSPLGT